MIFIYLKLFLKTLNIFGKSNIKVDWKKKTITEQVKTDNQLDKTVCEFLCNYYRKNLGMFFAFSVTEYGYEITMPIMQKIPIKYVFYNPEERYSNTKEIIRPLEEDKYFTPNRYLGMFAKYVDVYCYDCRMKNFFYYNKKIYLLPFGNFFFVVRNKNGEALTNDFIVEQNEYAIKQYNSNKKHHKKYNITKNNMMVY